MEFAHSFLNSALPARVGARPRTCMALPHVQLDQWPPPEIAKRLVEMAVNIPGVRPKESRMAFPSSLALCLKDDVANGPPESFIDNHEFCLLHCLPEAGVHLTLPGGIRERVVELGWAEQHPGARAGIIPETVAMLYAPRDAEELDIAFQLICISSRFAKGALSGLKRDEPIGRVLSWAG